MIKKVVPKHRKIMSHDHIIVFTYLWSVLIFSIFTREKNNVFDIPALFQVSVSLEAVSAKASCQLPLFSWLLYSSTLGRTTKIANDVSDEAV